MKQKTTEQTLVNNPVFRTIAGEAERNSREFCRTHYSINPGTFLNPKKLEGYGGILLTIGKSEKPISKVDVQIKMHKVPTSNSSCYNQLVGAKLIESKNRKGYTLTELGRNYLTAWLGTSNFAEVKVESKEEAIRKLNIKKREMIKSARNCRDGALEYINDAFYKYHFIKTPERYKEMVADAYATEKREIANIRKNYKLWIEAL